MSIRTCWMSLSPLCAASSKITIQSIQRFDLYQNIDNVTKNPSIWILYFFWIRCTVWFNAGSRIIENNLMGWFLVFLAAVGGANPAGYLTYPKISNASIFSTILRFYQIPVHQILFFKLLLILLSLMSRFNETGYLTLTETGMEDIGKCTQENFHPHSKESQALYFWRRSFSLFYFCLASA